MRRSFAVPVAILLRWTVAASAIIAIAPRGEAHATTVVSFGYPAFDFALDSTTGELATVDPNLNLVQLYGTDVDPDKTLKPRLRAGVGKTPVSIVFKQFGDRRFFVVGCAGEGTIHVLDAADLKPVAQIPVNRSPVCYLAAGRSSTDPFVYYCYGDYQHAMVGRVDLKSMSDQGQIQQSSMHCAVSGRSSYLYRLQLAHLTTLHCQAIHESPSPEGNPRFESRGQASANFDNFAVDAQETFVAYGPKLYPATLGPALAELSSIEPYAFFASRPIVAGLSSAKSKVLRGAKPPEPAIVLVSTNTFAEIGRAAVPAGVYPPRSDQNSFKTDDGQVIPGGHRFRMFADDARRRVVVAYRDTLAVLNLDGLAIPDEPLLFVDADVAAPLVAGKKNAIPFRKLDPRVSCSLPEAVGDRKLVGDSIEWTPDESSIGPQTIELKTSYDGKDRVQRLLVRVVADGVGLPFPADALAVAPDGRTAFVWTKPADRDGYGRPQMVPAEWTTRCAVVDLADGKIAASGTLPFPVATAVIDSKKIFAVPRGTTAVTVVDRETLVVEKQAPLEHPLISLHVVADRWLVACSEDGRRVKYSLPELNVAFDYQASMYLPSRYVERSSRMAGGPMFGMRPVAGGWACDDGDVFDSEFERPLLVKQTPFFIPMNFLQNGIPADYQKFHPGGYYPSDLNAPFSPPIANKTVVAVDRLEEPRVTVLLTRTISQGPMDAAVVYEVEFPDAARSGLAAGTVVLHREAYDRNRPNSAPAPLRGEILVRDGSIYCVVHDRLSKIPFPQLAPRTADPPPAFERRQSTLVLDAARSTSLKHAIRGGKGPFQFRLLNPTPGLEISPTDGTIVADGVKLVETAVERVIRPKSSVAPDTSRNVLETPLDVDAYVARNASHFKQITGRDPTGVPVAVVVGIEAQDSASRSTMLTYQIMLDLPRERINRRLRDLASEGAADPIAARTRQLEERIRTLEAELQRISKFLEN